MSFDTNPMDEQPADKEEYEKWEASQQMEPKCEVDPGEPAGPKTLDEAQWYHKGFHAGLAAYAVAVGHGGLKMNNDTIRRLMDEQGWKTIETFEQISAQTPEQQHGEKTEGV
jgi:hypothetical protein